MDCDEMDRRCFCLYSGAHLSLHVALEVCGHGGTHVMVGASRSGPLGRMNSNEQVVFIAFL